MGALYVNYGLRLAARVYNDLVKNVIILSYTRSDDQRLKVNTKVVINLYKLINTNLSMPISRVANMRDTKDKE